MAEFFMLTLVAALMVISPEPDFVIVAKNSLVQRRTSGLYTAMGIATAVLCHVAVNLFGIGVVIPQSVVATPIAMQIFYGFWISTMTLFWFSLVACFFTNAAIGKKMEAFKHWLERVTGGVLILLGIKLLNYELSR